jgi:hypothetical protein
MNPTTRAALITAIASLPLITACDAGDEYTEDGQLVEKTDVRVTGVALGRAVDPAEQLTDEADTFAPTDTIYASVRTKGSSPKTVLGVRWMAPTNYEITGDNRVIRPTGDTSNLFTFQHMVALAPGRYTLEMRVNGKVVKSAGFTVSKTAEPHRESAEKPPRQSFRIASVEPFVRKAFARLTNSVRGIFDRAPGDQSPFEWKGMRGGMAFSKLDRISTPGAPWNCTPFFLSAVGVERNIALESDDFSAGNVKALVDTVDHRVFSIGYHVTWMHPDDPQKVKFEREVYELATAWDKIPGVFRHPRRDEGHGPSLARWESADSAWSARISYYQGTTGPARPDGFEIEEINFGNRLTAEIPDSIKGQMRNPESAFYRNQTATGGCPALLQSVARN